MASRRSDKPLFSTMTLRYLRMRATPAVLSLVAVTMIAAYKMDIMSFETPRSAVADVVAPVLSVASAPIAAAVDNIDGVQTLRSLKAENLRLREENAKLMESYESALKLSAENKSLRELLNVKADPAMEFITTRVVSDPGGSFVKSVLLPAGEKDGVSKGDAVMAGRGLMGRVMETGRVSARVLLINDLNSRIPVMIQNTRTKAILAGKNKSLLRLERLPIDSGLSLGQRVVTSGDGGQLPADIPVGVIVAIGKEGVWVKPLADIDSASHVQVINTKIRDALYTGDLK